MKLEVNPLSEEFLKKLDNDLERILSESELTNIRVSEARKMEYITGYDLQIRMNY